MQSHKKIFFYLLLFCLTTCIVICEITQLYWLANSLFFVAASYALLWWCSGFIKRQSVRKYTKAILLILYVITISIAVNLFVVETYIIPSVSMEDAIFTNDIVLVNKLLYGPKIITDLKEISWVNFLLKRTVGPTHFKPDPSNFKRAQGLSEVNKGDVLVFRLYDNYFVVKRCVGSAGDTFNLVNGEIYINNKKSNSPKTVRSDYRLIIDNIKIYNYIIDSLTSESKNFQYNYSNRNLTASFTISEICDLEKRFHIRVLRLVDSDFKKQTLFSSSLDKNWTTDNMGPIIVPRKGFKIKLTLNNYLLYKNIFERFQPAEFKKNGKNFYINGIKTQTFTFTENYYFVMGDNRKEAMDSRFFGFIAEEDIIGKAQYILCSYHGSKFRWDRIFKKIL